MQMYTYDFLHLIAVHQSSQTIVPPPASVYWPAKRFATVIPVYPCVLPSQLEWRCAIFSSLTSELTSGKMRGGFRREECKTVKAWGKVGFKCFTRGGRKDCWRGVAKMMKVLVSVGLIRLRMQTTKGSTYMTVMTSPKGLPSTN